MSSMCPLPLSAVTVDGSFAEQLERILEARYRSPNALGTVTDEAVSALTQRLDDRLDPQRGLWRGEFFGKWALAAIDCLRMREHGALHARLERAYDQLLASRDGDGYIGSYHDSRCGLDDPERFEWNVWGRKYSLWALIEGAAFLDRPELLQAAEDMLDHLREELGPDSGHLASSGCFNGLPSASILLPVVLLHRATGTARHRDYADWIVAELCRDILPDFPAKVSAGIPIADWYPQPERWAKAYEFMSCIEGLWAYAQLPDREAYRETVQGIVALIREYELGICGGVSCDDKFGNARRILQCPSEICDSVHFLRLSALLLAEHGDVRCADDIESILYNTLMGSASEDGFWGLRRRLLAGRHWVAPQHCGLSSHHCCVANLPRALLLICSLAVMETASGPVVQLYLPGEYCLGNGGRLRIETAYPADGRIACYCNGGGLIRLRIPTWSSVKTVLLDGRSIEAGIDDGYIIIDTSGEQRIDLELDMHPRWAQLDGQAYRAACFGPLALARDARFEDGDIHAELACDPTERLQFHARETSLDLQPCAAPDGIAHAFAFSDAEGRRIACCDAASAGNDWYGACASDFRVWLPGPSIDPFGSRYPHKAGNDPAPSTDPLLHEA